MMVAAPSADVALAPDTRAAAAPSFEALYERHFDEVERWLRALGVPMGDLEDLAQEVFLVVRRKLPGFDGRNVGGWLFRIASHTASDHRRRGWFKHLFSRRAEVPLEGLPSAADDPSAALEDHEARAALDALLARMGEKRRVTFVLFEIEGYSGEEIAALLGVPLGTVWTRLHHARKEFHALVAERLRKEER